MGRVLIALCLLSATVSAQRRLGRESTPEQCSDHLDNDGNGDIDCDDPKCHGIGQCKGLPIIEVEGGEERLQPRSQVIAGAVMIAAGVGVLGASSVVFVDGAQQQANDKRAVEYTMGGIMGAAGAAIAIGGGFTLRKGVLRRREEVEMGLALGPNRLDLRVRF